MPIYDSDTITRFSNRAEEAFAREFPCILRRYGLAAVSGTSLYAVPSTVISIRKVTWKGERLWPLSHREFREEIGPRDASGTPVSYIFNNIGEFYIKLFPTPNVSISATQTNLFTPSVIEAKFIVEYWSMPDFSADVIPSYLRRRLLAAGAAAGCAALEGRGKNNKGAKYWETFYESLKALYGQRLNELNTLPRRFSENGVQDSSNSRIGRLPSNFGTSVDGEF